MYLVPVHSCGIHEQPQLILVIERSPCDEAIHLSGKKPWIASLRSQ
jgi:hypothetical protein